MNVRERRREWIEKVGTCNFLARKERQCYVICIFFPDLLVELSNGRVSVFDYVCMCVCVCVCVCVLQQVRKGLSLTDRICEIVERNKK